MTLAEALAQVDLEAGRTYGCVVNGNRVTIRVASLEESLPAAVYDESDVMLDAWCELPPQGEEVPAANVRFGELPLDLPEIPQDEE